MLSVAFKSLESDNQTLVETLVETQRTYSFSEFSSICKDDHPEWLSLQKLNIDDLQWNRLYTLYPHFLENVSTVWVIRLSVITEEDIKSFSLSNNSYNIIVDDYYLIDTLSNNAIVGYVDIKGGVLLITSVDYQNIFVEPTKQQDYYLTSTDNNTKDLSTIWTNITNFRIIDYSNSWNPVLTNNILSWKDTPNGQHWIILKGVTVDNNCSNLFKLTISTTSDIDDCIFDVNGSWIGQPDPISTNCSFDLVNQPKCARVDDLPQAIATLQSNGIYWALDQPASVSISKNGGISFDTLQSIPVSGFLLNTNFVTGIIRFTTSIGYRDYYFRYDIILGLTYRYIGEFHTNPGACPPGVFKLEPVDGLTTPFSLQTTGDLKALEIDTNLIQVIGQRGTLTVTRGTCVKSISFSGNSDILLPCDLETLDLIIKPTGNESEYTVEAKLNSVYQAEYPNWTVSGQLQIIGPQDQTILKVKAFPGGGTIQYKTTNFCGNVLTKTVSIGYQTPITTTLNTTIPSTTTKKPTTTLPPIDETDLSIDFQVTDTNIGINEQFDIVLLVNNDSTVTATNVEVTINLPVDLVFVQGIFPNDIYKNGNIIKVQLPSIIPGQQKVIRFVVKNNAPLASQLLVWAEITKSDQFDVDSTVNNQNINEDDYDSVKFTVIIKETTRPTTYAPCEPIIREDPYTQVLCERDVLHENTFGGRIHISAINPITSTSEGLEYSYRGDSDVYYVDYNISPVLPDGLYTYWVRIKDFPHCKKSGQIRVACSDMSTTDWELLGSTCYIVDAAQTTINPATNCVAITNASVGGLADGTNRSFILPTGIKEGSLEVLWNGLQQVENIDYVLLGNILLFTIAPEAEASIKINYLLAL